MKKWKWQKVNLPAVLSFLNVTMSHHVAKGTKFLQNALTFTLVLLHTNNTLTLLLKIEVHVHVRRPTLRLLNVVVVLRQ